MSFATHRAMPPEFSGKWGRGVLTFTLQVPSMQREPAVFGIQCEAKKTKNSIFKHLSSQTSLAQFTIRCFIYSYKDSFIGFLSL